MIPPLPQKAVDPPATATIAGTAPSAASPIKRGQSAPRGSVAGDSPRALSVVFGFSLVFH